VRLEGGGIKARGIKGNERRSKGARRPVNNGNNGNEGNRGNRGNQGNRGGAHASDPGPRGGEDHAGGQGHGG
jgi:hypothetical protein